MSLECMRVRSRKGVKCFFCIKKRQFFQDCSFCSECDEKEYKKITPLRKKSKAKRTKAVNITSKVKKIVYARDNGCCIFCGQPGLPEAHVVPRSKGGLGTEQNIITACRLCHYKLDQTAARASMLEYANSYLEENYAAEELQSVIYRKEVVLLC